MGIRQGFSGAVFASWKQFEIEKLHFKEGWLGCDTIFQDYDVSISLAYNVYCFVNYFKGGFVLGVEIFEKL